MADIVFVGCSLAEAAAPLTPAGGAAPRRQVVLGVLVFLHPQGVPDLEKRLRGNGLLTNVIGNPLETTIALSHLLSRAHWIVFLA